MWSKSGNKFNFYEKEEDLPKLEPGIYMLKYGRFGSMYLELKKKQYSFPYKMYGGDRFPERVIQTFQSVTSNLGVLLCGLKGTGKTVQAERICNLSNLPVILVAEDFNKGADLISYLGLIDQECVVMIDEYEKLFGKSDSLLAIMDGALNAKHRRLFVLTANTLNVSDAMLDRPSRVYYLKKFGNLAASIIREVVDDMLAYPVFREEVIEYLSTLDIVTIDIVKTVIGEVNRFNEPPAKFKDILNVTVVNHQRWDVFDEEGEELLTYVSSYHTNPFMKNYELKFKDFGDKYVDFGFIKTCNAKTGKVTMEDGKSLTVKKAKSFVSRIARGTNAMAAAVERRGDETTASE